MTMFCVRVRDTLAFCACATDLGIIISQLSSISSNLQITPRAFITNSMSYTLPSSGRPTPYFRYHTEGPSFGSTDLRQCSVVGQDVVG